MSLFFSFLGSWGGGILIDRVSVFRRPSPVRWLCVVALANSLLRPSSFLFISSALAVAARGSLAREIAPSGAGETNACVATPKGLLEANVAAGRCYVRLSECRR